MNKESTFQLSILERFRVMELLPQKGTYATLRECSSASEVLRPTADEERECAIVSTPDGNMRIPASTLDKASERKAIVLSEFVRSLVASELSKLEGKGELDANQITLYELFVMGGASHANAG